jgi:hypothetical protein
MLKRNRNMTSSPDRVHLGTHLGKGHRHKRAGFRRRPGRVPLCRAGREGNRKGARVARTSEGGPETLLRRGPAAARGHDPVPSSLSRATLAPLRFPSLPTSTHWSDDPGDRTTVGSQTPNSARAYVGGLGKGLNSRRSCGTLAGTVLGGRPPREVTAEDAGKVVRSTSSMRETAG